MQDWNTCFIPVERQAKETCAVLLFNISGETLSVASMAEVRIMREGGGGGGEREGRSGEGESKNDSSHLISVQVLWLCQFADDKVSYLDNLQCVCLCVYVYG